MRIENLRAYVCVLEEGSFTKAAERLLVTQSALSRQISELERSVGRPLISRTTRQVRVTPAGRILYAHAQRMLTEWDLAEKRIQQLSGRPERLRLGCASEGLLSIALDAAADKGLLEKGIDVSLSRVHPERAIRMLRGGQLDCVLIYRMSLSDEAGIGTAVLGAAAMTAALRPAMMPAGKHTLKMAQLSAWADIRCPSENGETAYEALDDAFRRAGLTPPPCIEAEPEDAARLLSTERCMRLAPQTEPVPEGMAAWPVTDLRVNGDILLARRADDLRQETELLGEAVKSAVSQALSR